ncbi:MULTISPECIES: type I polyketide synthase [Sorangium]|uniref:Polyketide synthase n=1 Tax=Sorangium cellulosum TaxID=56 RepID=A0A4P2QPC2_SORCE|nr:MULTISPECIES: type I polyketide synthase [Sorangium]AUX31980.1 polyketide synthase [Sorangium cellulosum]WCQ91353.1 Narbonolide/10-deoxymethynolide synthase PikA1, modules 1 and 2 [Sorangium sp. Soce836]
MSTALLEEYRARLRKAMVKLGELEAELEATRRAAAEPIAIIGMGCRFPGGATSPEAFFRLLEGGADAVAEVPSERFRLGSAAADPADPGARAARWGAFLKEDVGLFDAAFFGIAPREARAMDPQQRLLLEVAWEALERAGQVPEELFGGRVGVFVGTSMTDYAELLGASVAESGDVYTVTGTGHCFAAGRLSYAFGFQGPSMIVDTACSSSLVAVHLACQSLRSGDSALALAGGVNLILSATPMRLLARSQVLSPDGRCKVFDAAANGFVRGEGCGMIVLKRLSDAQRDGDPILALIRGSAVNQDGRSTGLTAPNVLSQKALLQKALENARTAASSIGYVETHGTGTSLGDPIELEALKAVLGGPRADGSACVLGAVKTNIGHLEAAAGVAGLIKAVVCLEREVVPRNLHFRALNPRIALEGTPFTIPTAPVPWKRGEKPRLAGVSSFGLSGTNAHVIVEEAPRLEPAADAREASSYLLPLSAKGPEALSALARLYRDALVAEASREGGARLHDIAYTASARRSHHEHRLAVVGRGRAEMAAALSAFEQGEPPAGVASGKVPPGGQGRVAFVFSGQGSQWVGMGRSLLGDEPVFRAAIEACDALVQRHAGFSLLEALAAPEASSRLNETEVAQPALFAIQVALSDLLRSWGVTPDAVVGHSVGEAAAAYVAGALSLETAVRLVCLRGRVMQKATGLGKMASVALGAEDVARALRGYEDRLSIAAINDPGSVVLSGEAAPLEELLGRLRGQGVLCRMLRVNYAFHSPQMAPLEGELARVLGRLAPRRAAIAMYSSVTGAPIEGESLDSGYFARGIRAPVLFAQAVEAAASDGHRLFVEVGPHPVLALNLRQCLGEERGDGRSVTTLRRGHDERESLLRAMGELYAHGQTVAWPALFSRGGRTVALPTYPWQRQRYWLETPGATPRGQETPRPEATEGSFGSAPADWLYEARWRSAPLSPSRPPAPAHWVVVADEGTIGDRLADALEAEGATCSRLRPGTASDLQGQGGAPPDPASAAELGAWWADLLAARGPVRGVVYLAGLDAVPEGGDGLAAAIRRSVTRALAWVQVVARSELSPPPKLWLVSRGAVAAAPGDAVPAPWQAPLWGLGRVLSLEHPEVWGGLVDLAPSAEDGEAAALAAHLLASDGEDQIALRGVQRYAARLARGALGEGAREVALDPGAAYLVTGELRAPTLDVARWMVDRGARQLCILGADEPDEGAQAALRALEAKGARVAAIRADVADAAALGEALAALTAGGCPLRGVVHAAEALEDGVLLQQSADRFARVLRPKAEGAWNLHLCTRSLDLDFFVLFSSGASLLGVEAQGNYAAANAFLDALAHHRRAAGLPALSVNWGAWAGTALAEALERQALRWHGARGAGVIAPAEGLRWLERLVASGAIQAAVLPIDASRRAEPADHGAVPALFAELSREARAPEAEARPDLRARLAQVAPGARRAMVAELVQGEVDRVLGMDPSQKAPPQRGFFDMGMDSLMAVELKNRLQRSVGRPLSSMVLFNHPTIEALTEHLASSLLGDSAPAPPLAHAGAPARAEMIDEVEQLSDHEMTALIDRELSSLLSA